MNTIDKAKSVQSICHLIFGEHNIFILIHLIRDIFTIIATVLILILANYAIEFIFTTWGKDVIFFKPFISLMHDATIIITLIILSAKGIKTLYRWWKE